MHIAAISCDGEQPDWGSACRPIITLAVEWHLGVWVVDAGEDGDDVQRVVSDLVGGELGRYEVGFPLIDDGWGLGGVFAQDYLLR